MKLTSEKVQIYRVLGYITQKLAKAYAFALSSNNRHIFSFFFINPSRSLPNFSGDRDPHFYKLVNGLSDSNLNSYVPPVNPLPRTGSLNNLSVESIEFDPRGYGESKVHITENTPYMPPRHMTRRSLSTIDLTLSNSLVPSSPGPKREFGQKTGPLFQLRNGYEIAQTCRYNAQLAQTLQIASLFHIWTMLAVCFEMLSLAGMEYHPSKQSTGPIFDGADSTKKLESCRRMVISGLSYDWSRHALGRPLLRKIWRTLSHIGDLQTLSTITCALGGPRATAYYLDEPTKYNPQSLDRMLLRYSDILHRWQCHVEATEVIQL